MGENRGVYTVLVGKPEERDHFEGPGIDGRKLRQILRKWDVSAWTTSMWLRIKQVKGTWGCNKMLGIG